MILIKFNGEYLKEIASESTANWVEGHARKLGWGINRKGQTLELTTDQPFIAVVK